MPRVVPSLLKEIATVNRLGTYICKTCVYVYIYTYVFVHVLCTGLYHRLLALWALCTFLHVLKFSLHYS